MDGKFASISSLLELSQKLDALPETTAVKVQKQLLANKLQQSFDDFQKLGVSLPDLFAKFQGQLYKADIIKAQDSLKNKEQESGGEITLTDLINEDLIADLKQRVSKGMNLDPNVKSQYDMDIARAKAGPDPKRDQLAVRNKYLTRYVLPQEVEKKRLDIMADPLTQFVSQRVLDLGSNRMSQPSQDVAKKLIVAFHKKFQRDPTAEEIRLLDSLDPATRKKLLASLLADVKASAATVPPTTAPPATGPSALASLLHASGIAASVGPTPVVTMPRSVSEERKRIDQTSAFAGMLDIDSKSENDKLRQNIKKIGASKSDTGVVAADPDKEETKEEKKEETKAVVAAPDKDETVAPDAEAVTKAKKELDVVVQDIRSQKIAGKETSLQALVDKVINVVKAQNPGKQIDYKNFKKEIDDYLNKLSTEGGIYKDLKYKQGGHGTKTYDVKFQTLFDDLEKEQRKKKK